MADPIQIATDLWGTAGMKPEVIEDINVLWGRKAMSNLGALYRKLFYDPVVVHTQGGFNLLESNSPEIFVNNTFAFKPEGSRQFLTAQISYAFSIPSAVAATFVPYINEVNNGTWFLNDGEGVAVATKYDGSDENTAFQYQELATIAHGINFGDHGTIDVGLRGTQDGIVTMFGTVYNITVWNWGTYA